MLTPKVIKIKYYSGLYPSCMLTMVAYHDDNDLCVFLASMEHITAKGGHRYMRTQRSGNAVGWSDWQPSENPEEDAERWLLLGCVTEEEN